MSAVTKPRPENPLVGIPVGLLAMKCLRNGTTVKATKGNHEALLEPKLDGHRILLWRHSTGVRAYTRGGRDKTGRLTKLVAEAARVLPVGTWVDGEVIGGAGRGAESADWSIAQSALGSSVNYSPAQDKVAFAAFDLLALDGFDIRREALSERRGLLEDLLDPEQMKEMGVKRIAAVPRLKAIQSNHDRLIRNGYEGTVLKFLDSRYNSGQKGPGWYALKAVDTEDAFIVGYEPGKGSIKGLIGSLVFAQYVDGVETVRGSCSGMSMKMRREISANRKKYLNRVIEFAYNGRFPDGGYRHPQWKRFRTDKTKKECIDRLGDR